MKKNENTHQDAINAPLMRLNLQMNSAGQSSIRHPPQFTV